jgi:porphobilinogen synthase
MVRETVLTAKDFIYPLFVISGHNQKQPIPSLVNLFHYSPDLVVEAAREVYQLGIPAVLLFKLD